MIFRRDSELIVKAVMPDLGHLGPVIDDAMFDGVIQFEDSFFGDGFFTDISLFIAKTLHDFLVFGSADDSWKGCSGAIVSAHTSLTDAWAVVNDDGCVKLWLHSMKSIFIKLNAKYPGLKGENC